MSILGAGAAKRIVVETFQETTDMLNAINDRLVVVEETTKVVEKIWRFLKYATPAMITTLLAGVSHDSILYKLGALLVGLLQNGTPPAG